MTDAASPRSPHAGGADYLPTWEEFSDHDIFVHLDAISSFSLVIDYPGFRQVAGSGLQSMGDRLYERVYDLLSDTKSYGFEHLERRTSGNDILITYADDENHFAVYFEDAPRLRLVREGSTLERFYAWYRRIMPKFSDVTDGVEEALQVIATEGGSARELKPVRASFIFNFVLYDFATGPGGRRRPIKNSHLVRRAVTHVPGPTGQLVEFSDALLPVLGRIDLSISRFERSPAGEVRELYRVQAPGNRNYGSLWLEFHYIGETSETDSGGNKSITRFDEFLRMIDLPVSDFLRNKALCNFLPSLTEQLTFKSAIGRLP